MNLILYQPDIPQNMGAMLRLCACLGVQMSIIEPCGFLLDDRRMDRVAMDYKRQVQLIRYQSWEVFKHNRPANRIVLLTTKAQTPYWDFSFESTDQILVGQESCGVPTEVADYCDSRLVVPMKGQARSLNVAMAAAIVLGEAQRQCGHQRF